MSARDELRDCFLSDSRDRFEAAADAHRAEVIAERDAQIVAWLAKKAGEYGTSNRENRTASDAVALMADKLSRGAVRDDETGVSELYRLRSENNRLRSEARQLQNDITGACLARHEEEQENARLRAERHSTNQALSDAAEQLRVQRDRIAELEAERKKYVGVEPTIAEEMAYISRCLDAVYAVCDAAEKQATRWEQPLPVPEWVALIRNAADGVMVNAPALPPVPQQRQEEDPHTSPLHHDYVVPRDLPTIPRQTTGRCPKGHTFEDCTCGSAV
ncbi:hypothetical protein ACN9M0_24955 [Streptomyces sp. R-07]|uniref:hypothetical protein n=1 Tax=Streptomyces sp. R-07 TaxID=3404052 RepID=UPI003CF53E07